VKKPVTLPPIKIVLPFPFPFPTLKEEAKIIVNKVRDRGMRDTNKRFAIRCLIL